MPLKKTYRLRLIFLILLSVVLFAAIEARLFDLQIRDHARYEKLARTLQNKTVSLTPRRGDILDRNGNTLATSYLSDNIILDMKKYRAPREQLAADLAKALKIDPAQVTAGLARPGRIVLARAVTEDTLKVLDRISKKNVVAAECLEYESTGGKEILLDTRALIEREPSLISALATTVGIGEYQLRGYFTSDLNRRYILCRKASAEMCQAVALLEDEFRLPPGAIFYEENSKRFYPNGPLASHVLGYTQIDDSGDNIPLGGIELKYNEWLKGSYRNTRVPVAGDLKRHNLAPLSDDIIEGTIGDNVILTLDRQIQMFAERALRRRVGEVQALGGIALVMDIPTGEILAMASCPDFDPNDFAKATDVQKRNRVLSNPIEIGSVMKILTTALLLDKGLVSPEEMVDCKGGFTVIDGRKLTDSHKLSMVPFREAFAYSSNIALATLGKRLEPAVYYDGLWQFGLGRKTGIDLPGEEIGILHPLKDWKLLSRTSLPIGYEAALTGMQVISALAAIGNDGVRMRPHIVREIRTSKGQLVQKFDPEPLGPIASPETCKTMLDLMEGVVVYGTGDSAQIPGYRVGGKTGTTRKSDTSREERRYIASFAGLMPVDNPRLAIYIYIDEPSVGIFYGGTVAAPVFQEIALQATHLLAIPPNDPVAYAQAREKLTAAESTPTTTTLARATGDPEPFLGEGGSVDDSTTDVEAGAAAEAAGDEAANPAGTPALPNDLAFELDRAAAAGPRIPDCTGQTMVEALGVLTREQIKFKMLGSGVVVRQEPPAGAPLPKEGEVTIIFAHPSAATRHDSITNAVVKQ